MCRRDRAYNAAVVVEAAVALCEKGLDISDEAILGGIAGARFPAVSYTHLCAFGRGR